MYVRDIMYALEGDELNLRILNELLQNEIFDIYEEDDASKLVALVKHMPVHVKCVLMFLYAEEQKLGILPADTIEEICEAETILFVEKVINITGATISQDTNFMRMKWLRVLRI